MRMTPGGIVVNARFRARRITGVERYAHEITRRFEERVRLVAPRRYARGLAGHLWEQRSLPRLIAASELLWSPANTGPLSVANQVVTIHDLSVLDHPDWFERRFGLWYRYLLPRLARRVKKVITVSAFSRARIVDVLGVSEARVVCVPDGVDAMFQPSPRPRVAEVGRKYGLPASYILAVGSLEPRKNLGVLFHAWPRVHSRFPDVELVAAGDVDRSFRGAGFERVPGGARVIGPVNDDDLPALYTGAIAFVFPSVYEGFGLPALEAMACGAPVVASSATSLPEVVGDAGLLVNPLDAEAMAAGLCRLIEDGALRDTIRQRGLERARQFTWERTADLTWQVLQEAADRY